MALSVPSADTARTTAAMSAAVTQDAAYVRGDCALASTSICSARSRCSPVQSSVAWKTALPSPCHVSYVSPFTCWWLRMLPLPVPTRRTGPDTTEYVKLTSLPRTSTPAASTSCARMKATSWPSKYSALPVPVESEGTSTLSSSFAAFVLTPVSSEWLPCALPLAAMPMTVTLRAVENGGAQCSASAEQFVCFWQNP